MKLVLIPVTTGRIEDYCTAREAAQTKGVTVTSVYDAMDAGRLTGYQVHGQTMLRVAEVEAWEVRRNARRAKAAGDEQGRKKE